MPLIAEHYGLGVAPAEMTLASAQIPNADPRDWDALDDEGRRELLWAWIREVVVQGTTVDLVLADLAGRDGAIWRSVLAPV